MMKLYIFFLLYITLLLHITPVPAQVFKNHELQVRELDKNLWIIETGDMSTMYIVAGTTGALLIDTGRKCEDLSQVVKEVTSLPLKVVLTHTHWDHAGNIQYFDEIYMHPADTVLLDTPYRGKIHFIDEGYVFDLGGGKLIEVIHMPAHTPGSVVLLDREKGHCYSGDAFGSGQVWLQLRPVAPMRSYIKCCRKMLAIMDQGVDSIYCGHFQYVKSAMDREFISSMLLLAESIQNGTARNIEPFTTQVSINCENPMIAREGGIAIVFDPQSIK